MQNILQSRICLYTVLLLVVCNITALVVARNYFIPIVFFLVLSIFVSYTNNMIVSLGVSLVASNTVYFLLDHASLEGMQAKEAQIKNNSNINKKEKRGEKEKEKEKEKEREKEKETEAEKKVKVEGMQASYKELMSMQGEILKNMSSLEQSLNNADSLLLKMAKRVS